MAAATGMVGILEKSLERGDRLMERLAEKDQQPTTAIPADPPPTAEEKLNESLTLLGKLQEFTKGAPSTDPIAMMNAVVMTAKMISESKDPSPYLNKISELEAKLANEKAETMRSQLSAIQEQLRQLRENPQSTVTTTDGSNLQTVVEKAVSKVVEDLGLGEVADKTPWWVQPLITQGLPVASALLQRILTPNAPPASTVPSAVPLHSQPAQYQQPQPQIAAPAIQPQPAPQNDQAAQIQQILVAISGPVVDYLSRGEGGDDFADMLVAEHGQRGYRMISAFSSQEITDALYGFQLTAPHMMQFQRENVLKFAEEFKAYTPAAYDIKMAAEEK